MLGRVLERDGQDGSLGCDRKCTVDRPTVGAFDYDAFDEARRPRARLIRRDHDAEGEQRSLQRRDDGGALPTRDLDRGETRTFLLESNLWMLFRHV